MNCKTFFCILDIHLFSVMGFAELFSYSVSCLFTFFMVFMAAQKFLTLMVFSLFFLLLFMCLVSYLRIHCLSKVQKFTTTLSSEFYRFSTYIADFDPF